MDSFTKIGSGQYSSVYVNPNNLNTVLKFVNNDITCRDLMAEFVLHQSIKNKTNVFLTQENDIIIPECRNFNYYESINKQHINISKKQ